MHYTHMHSSHDLGHASGQHAGVVAISAARSDAALAAQARETWRCSRCGHVERRGDPAELRQAACWHARGCAEAGR